MLAPLRPVSGAGGQDDQHGPRKKRSPGEFVFVQDDDAIVFGHARDGNLHFVLNQSFDDPAAVRGFDGSVAAGPTPGMANPGVASVARSGYPVQSS